jgi:hypothetical protein
MKKRQIKFSSLVFLLIALTASFVLAAHVIRTSTGGTSYNVNEDVYVIYNISVNNTDPTATANITQVNITIPGSFTFVINSNVTDAGTHTFSNTSTVLSWSNNGLVMNLTVNYFRFNATASTPGTYNVTITTSNSTYTSISNISVTVNDTTATAIYLISPTNETSSTTTAYNFTFNSTDHNNITSCTLYINGEEYNTISEPNHTGGTNGMYNSSFAVGTYNWSVNCTDSVGNTGNSEVWVFTVESEPAAATSPTTDQSSSGSKGFYPIYQVKKNDLMKGYKISLGKNWKANLEFSPGEKHTLTILEINGQTTKISLSSTYQEATLSLNDPTKKFELSGDSYYDLMITLNSISTGTLPKATVTFQEIYEKMPEQQPSQPEINEQETQEEPSQSPQEEVSADQQSQTSIFPLLTVFVLIGLAVVIFLLIKKSKSKNK